MHPAFQRQKLRSHLTISKGLSAFILKFVLLLFPSSAQSTSHYAKCARTSHYMSLLTIPFLLPCFPFVLTRKKAKQLIAHHDPSHHFWGSQKQNSSLCAWRDLQKALAFDRNDAQFWRNVCSSTTLVCPCCMPKR